MSPLYLLPMLAHTWAPKGKTPVLFEQAGRAHLSLIAAIAPNGRLYVAGQDQSFCGADIAWFLSKLYGRYRKRDLLIIWRGRPADGASIHGSKEVKAFLKARPGRFHLERLPAYSPELNPVELVWNHRSADAAQTTAKKSSVFILGRTDNSSIGASKLVRDQSEISSGLLSEKGDRILYRLIHGSITFKTQANSYIIITVYYISVLKHR